MVERYTDWTHVHVSGGNREAAAPYVPSARKLLGQVIEDAAYNQLGTHKLVRQLDDGTVITAEKHGSIPRVTIEPAPAPGGSRPVLPFRDFVAWPSGPASDTDPVILRYRSRQQDWYSFFFKGNSAGHDNVAEDHRGSYIGAFPRGLAYSSDREARLAGAVTCWKNADGECLSIFNSSNRYWACKYAHPYLHYSTFVLHCGFIALDLQFFDSANDLTSTPYVLGAAFKDGHLYVVAAGLGALVFDAPPDSPTEAWQIWASPQFDVTSRQYRLLRFDLVVVTDPVTGISHYEAQSKSDTILTGFSSTPSCGLYSPWIFNQDVTEAVTYSLPGSVVLGYKAARTAQDTSTDEAFTGFATTGTYRVAIALDAASGSASVTSAGAGTAIAEDSGHVLNLVHVGGGAFDYTLGAATIPATRHAGAANAVGSSVLIRTLIDADLQEETVAFYETTTTITAASESDGAQARFDAALVIFRGGTETIRSTVGSTQEPVEDHASFISLANYIGTVSGGGLAALYATPLVILRGAGWGPTIWGYAGFLRLSRFHPTQGTRWYTTGGAYFRYSSSISWGISGNGYNNGLDQYNGSQPTNLPLFDVFGANSEATVCAVYNDMWTASLGDGITACITNATDMQSIVGYTAPVAKISLLGTPPKEQQLEQEAA